jgi:hypothetical protein
LPQRKSLPTIKPLSINDLGSEFRQECCGGATCYDARTTT